MAHAQVHGCDVEGQTALLGPDGQMQINEALATCGDLDVEASTVVWGTEALVFRDVRAQRARTHFEFASLEIADGRAVGVDGCLSILDTRCCGETLTFTPRSPLPSEAGAQDSAPEGVLLTAATCDVPGAGTIHAEEIRVSDDGVLQSVRTSADIGLLLPYPTGAAGAFGRAFGFVLPKLGFRSDVEAGAIEFGWFLPLGPTWDLAPSLSADTRGLGAFGLDLRQGHRRRSFSELDLDLLFDGARDARRWGLAAAGELLVRARTENVGMSLTGRFASDPMLWRDLGMSTFEREHLAPTFSALSWAGGATNRLWLGLRARGISPDDTTRTLPPTYLLGSLPTLGYGHVAQFDGLATLTLGARIDRYRRGNTPAERLNATQLFLGGELNALRLPGLIVAPGLWLELGMDFTDPVRTETYRRFHSQLVSTVDLSSAWVGGDDALRHLIDLGGTLLWHTLRDADEAGTRPASAPHIAARPNLEFQVRLDQALRGDGWWLDLPLRWTGTWNDVLVVSVVHGGPHLEVPLGDGALHLTQTTHWDTESSEVSSWRAGAWLRTANPHVAAPLGFGLPAGVLSLGGGLLHVGEGAVSELPSTFRRYPTYLRSVQLTVEESSDLGNAWAQIDFGPAGFRAGVAWPMDLGESADWSGTAWLGRWLGFRWTVEFRYLADETAIGLLQLTQGSETPDYPSRP